MENTQTNFKNGHEEWQLTDEEISNIELSDFPIHQNHRKTYALRVQQINLYEIAVTANNAEEAERKALDILKDNSDLGELLRSDFGHRTIEELQE